MSLLEFSNFGSTQLAGAISNVSVTANLISGSGDLFPSPTDGQYFVLEFNDQATGLDYEIVHVTGRSGDTITMVRGQEGTTARNWGPGDLAFSGPTAGQQSAFQQTLVYAGDPNGSVAGTDASVGTPPTTLWDVTNLKYWVCTTTGNSSSAVWRQFTSEGTQLPTGNCWLNFVSATQIRLSPFNGQNILVNGQQIQLGAGGVLASNTGIYINGVSGQSLDPSTWYLVSIASISGSSILRFWENSLYSHDFDSTAGNVGTEVITLSGAPISTDSFVGAILTNSSSQFQVQSIGVFTWFNQQLEIPYIFSNSTPGTVAVMTPPTKQSVHVKCWGGGGGGCQNAGSGAGGAGGGYAEGLYLVTPGISISTTVGIGGAASPTPSAGTGGTSSVGSLCSATGGTGGGTGSGPGGVGSGGNIANLQGQGGWDLDGSLAYVPGGSAAGGGGQGGIANSSGAMQVATVPGGGGAATGAAAGDGAAGQVILIYS